MIQGGPGTSPSAFAQILLRLLESGIARRSSIGKIQGPGLIRRYEEIVASAKQGYDRGSAVRAEAEQARKTARLSKRIDVIA